MNGGRNELLVSSWLKVKKESLIVDIRIEGVGYLATSNPMPRTSEIGMKKCEPYKNK